MKPALSRPARILIVISLVTAGILNLSTPRVRAESPIKILQTSTESKFRQSFTFHARVSSSAGKITAARVISRVLGDQSSTVFKVKDFTPAGEVDLEYVWDTRGETTPPWQILIYSWEVFDDAGNTLRSDPIQTEVSDDTRNWQKLSDGKVTVFWYDKDTDYGKTILSVTQQGFAHVSKATGYTPDQELRVVVYNSQDDFCTFWAKGGCLPWYGGITLTAITLQWARDTAKDQEWLTRQAIPHELSHAFLHYWLGGRIGQIPSWFNEGQAVNNQIEGLDEELARARSVTQSGNWFRFALIGTVNFIQTGPDDPGSERVRDWYAQAASMVNFLYDKYGLEILGKIVSKVKDGKSFEVAFTEATGMTMDQYELAWLKWMGVDAIPATFAPTPTDLPFPPTPTYEPTTAQ